MAKKASVFLTKALRSFRVKMDTVPLCGDYVPVKMDEDEDDEALIDSVLDKLWPGSPTYRVLLRSVQRRKKFMRGLSLS